MIDLSKIPTTPPTNLDRKKAEKITKERSKKIAELQYKMKAEGKHSLLVVFQGMDASGKDGAVKKVFGRCSQDGVNVYSFKKPTEEEFAHDFLWRVHKQCPQKGMVQIFNRSHYEDILIQRVHGWIEESTVEKRMKTINMFEELLEFDNDTHVMKFYLHISKEQQELELRERIEDPEKYWKHNDGDWKEREYWDKYRECYHYVLNNSSIPWNIVPVDKRWYRDYIISGIILEKLEGLDMEFPELDSEMF